MRKAFKAGIMIAAVLVIAGLLASPVMAAGKGVGTLLVDKASVSNGFSLAKTTVLLAQVQPTTTFGYLTDSGPCDNGFDEVTNGGACTWAPTDPSVLDSDDFFFDNEGPR